MTLDDFWAGLFQRDEVGRANSALGELGINTEGMGPAELVSSGAGWDGGLGFQPPNPIALGLQIGGALVKGSAADEALKRKQALAKAMGDYKLANAGQQTGIVNKYLEGNTPAGRDAATQQATDEARLGYDQTVGEAQAFAKPGEVAGNVSQAFRDSGAASADAASARNNKLIEALSTMRAPGLVQASNARRYGMAAGDVGALKTAAGNVGGAYGVDMDNVRPSPWATMTGDALGGLGKGIAMNDAAGKTAAALKKALG